MCGRMLGAMFYTCAKHFSQDTKPWFGVLGADAGSESKETAPKAFKVETCIDIGTICFSTLSESKVTAGCHGQSH
jgi:hypothetical protein